MRKPRFHEVGRERHFTLMYLNNPLSNSTRARENLLSTDNFMILLLDLSLKFLMALPIGEFHWAESRSL